MGTTLVDGEPSEVYSRKVILEFPQHLLDKPVVWNLVKRHNLVFNILRASIDDGHGYLVIELQGDTVDYRSGLDYLQELGVKVESLVERISYDKEKCTDCGACLNMCPTRSFTRDMDSQVIEFNRADCIACGMCARACPSRAISLELAQ